jgi:hypothetical protein
MTGRFATVATPLAILTIFLSMVAARVFLLIVRSFTVVFVRTLLSTQHEGIGKGIPLNHSNVKVYFDLLS